MAYKSNASPNLTNCVHRAISRLQADKLLLAAKQDGSFLIRESETVAGAYTLCLLVEGRVHQYRIFSDNDGMLSIQSEAGVKCRKFPDLSQLIQQYMLRGQKNGLAGPLLYPVMFEEPEDELDDEGEKVEEADSSNVVYEIIPPSEENGAAEAPDEQTEFGEFVARHFMLRFTHLNLSGCDGLFIDGLRQYIENDAGKDAATAAEEGTDMKHLKRLLDESVRDLDRHVESLMVKIDTCRQLFGPITTAPLTKSDKNTIEKPDLQDICDRLCRCKAAVKNLERKAELKFRDLSSMWKAERVVTDEASPPRGRLVKPIIPPMSFEAKLITLSQTKRIKLTVDIQAGKLLAIKPNKDVLNDSNVFTHDKIEQLIKSTSNSCRLDVKITGCKKKTYVFDDVRQRENFCQMVQQLKNMYSLNADVRQISIYVGTWNMANEVPNYPLTPWLKSDGLGKKRNSTMCMLPHDIYVVGTQESCMSEKEWVNKLKSLLYDSFVEEFFVVSTATLWGLRIVVLARPQHRNKFSHVQQSYVKTGIANALGNKGAVGVSFSFDGTSFCFVCCHLTSGSEKLLRRNQNARDILKGINLGSKNTGFYDASNHFHHIFFFGDFNYRLDDLDSEEIIRRVKESTNYNALLEYDQLRRAQIKREAFVGFTEEEIGFPPTYRFQKQTRDRYVWEKIKTTGKRINAPSWCDRILWRSYPETTIVNTSYGSVDTICSSDHKPVFSSFDVAINNQFASSQGGHVRSGDMKIIFEEISAEVKTTKQENFQVQFYSTCLESPVLSKPSMQFSNRKEGYCCPKWSAAQLVQLHPILDDWDYLQDRHLLLAVKTADDMESYGECVLSLKNALTAKPQPFCTILTHLGEETGSIRGLMHLKAGDNAAIAVNRAKCRNELIYMDTDFSDVGSNSSNLQTMLYADCAEIAAIRATPTDTLPNLPSKTMNTEPQNSASFSIPDYASVHKPLSVESSFPGGSELHNKHPSLSRTNSDVSYSSNTYEEAVPVIPPRKNNRPFSVSDSVSTDGLVLNKPPPPLAKFKPVIPERNASIATGMQGLEPKSETSLQLKPFVPQRVASIAAGAQPELPSSSMVDASSIYASPVAGSKHSESDGDEEYEMYTPIRSPVSVKEWLAHLNLHQYTELFMDSGWDHVKFLKDMTVEDLNEIGIRNRDHQVRILHSIMSMKDL